MSRTMFRQWMGVLVFGLACGWAGWAGARMAAAASPPGRARDASSAERPAPHTLFASAPTIAVAPDGKVTLHVDGEPLEWVLAEIDRQAGHAVAFVADHAESPRRISAATPTDRPCSVAQSPQAQDVVARVMRGTETERYDTLVQARSGGAVSEEMLRTLYQTDASPRVRLLAFEYAQEATEGDPGGRRTELEAARLLPDAVVAQEAARRLEALDAQARRAAPQVAIAH